MEAKAMSLETFVELMRQSLKEIGKREKLYVLFGVLGNNSKTFRISFGKNGLCAPSLFPKQFFKDEGIQVFWSSRYLPLLFVSEKYLDKKIVKILKESEVATLTHKKEA